MNKIIKQWGIEQYQNIPESFEKILVLDKDKDPTDMLFHLCRVVYYSKLNKDRESLDELLNLVDMKEVSTQMIVSVLRFTYSYRCGFPIWESKLKEAVKELDRRKLNTKSLLKGLV